jgi:hypothetical protein
MCDFLVVDGRERCFQVYLLVFFKGLSFSFVTDMSVCVFMYPHGVNATSSPNFMLIVLIADDGPHGLSYDAHSHEEHDAVSISMYLQEVRGGGGYNNIKVIYKHKNRVCSLFVFSFQKRDTYSNEATVVVLALMLPPLKMIKIAKFTNPNNINSCSKRVSRN